jgi:hypothetical protein
MERRLKHNRERIIVKELSLRESEMADSRRNLEQEVVPF